MQGSTNKTSVLLQLAGVLLCLVLVTAGLTSGLFARYASLLTADSAARVASFAIETDLDHIEIGSPDTPILELGGEGEQQSVQLPFYLISGSEVTVGYTVVVDFGIPLPDYLELTLSGPGATRTLVADGTASQFAFSDFGTLAIGADTPQRADLVLTISVTDLEMVTDEVSIPAVSLTVKAFQID